MAKTKKKKKPKNIQTLGKRKRATARATVKPGSGRVRINSITIDNIKPRYRRMRIREPLQLAGPLAKTVDINVRVNGGGIWGQADAVRTAIGNALVAYHKDDKLRQDFLDYDRSLLISDARRTEPHKPSRSSARQVSRYWSIANSSELVDRGRIRSPAFLSGHVEFPSGIRRRRKRWRRSVVRVLQWGVAA